MGPPAAAPGAAGHGELALALARRRTRVVRDGEAVLLRAAAEQMQPLLARLRAARSFVPGLLGDDPLARRP